MEGGPTWIRVVRRSVESSSGRLVQAWCSPNRRLYYGDPFGLLTMVIVMSALAVAMIGALIARTQQFLVALIVFTVMLWVMSTIWHAGEGAAPSAYGKRVLGS